MPSEAMPPEPDADRTERYRELRRSRIGRVEFSPRSKRQIVFETPIGDGPWWVAGTCDLYGGRLSLTELTVFPARGRATLWDSPRLKKPPIGKWRATTSLSALPAGGIPYRAIQEVHPAELTEWVYAWADYLLRAAPVELAVDVMRTLPERPLGKGTSDLELAELAQRQIDKADKGSRRPNQELAEETGLQWTQVRDRIRMARERGLLHGSAQGKAAGHLTPRARQLLASRPDEPRATRRGRKR